MTDSTRKAKHRSSRVRFAPVAILGGVAASAAIALSMSGTLAGFVAQITNNNNTATTGTLVMQETQTTGGANPVTTTCNSNSTSTGTNTANCSTINKYGGSSVMVPGVPVTTTVKIANTGTVPANTFTLATLGCTQPAVSGVTGGATDACSKFTLGVTQDGNSVAGASGTLTAVANKTFTLAGPIAPGASSTFAFTVTLPVQATTANPTADNPYQGVSVKQDLVWTFTS